jgi:hypothetical protein
MAGPLSPGRRRQAAAPPTVPLPRAPVDWPALVATIAAVAVVLATLVLCGWYLYRAFELNAPAA